MVTEPPPPAALAEVSAPPPKPETRPIAKPRPRPAPLPPPQPAAEPAQPIEPARPVVPQRPREAWPLPLSPQAGPPQVAAIPPPPASPTISSDYRTVLSGWLESHKRYPEEARQRGEQGRAVLRFRVDRYGRVLDYTVVGSTGFADLDAAVQNMMRGATLPPFPPGMPQSEIEVSVAIRFGLSR
ncbi:MAG: energy transducer TonB [Alphaproteobacteria bacterium]|nr:energy transducer TonB [Alphaproteobacteria bacterium]